MRAHKDEAPGGAILGGKLLNLLDDGLFIDLENLLLRIDLHEISRIPYEVYDIYYLIP